MPTFPTYRGELPECLNPLNPRHYFLLLYWVFFRPTALKCYLYQADPELYRSGRGTQIFHIWKFPSYRHLYVITLIITILLFLLVSLLCTLTISYIEGISINWLGWVLTAIIFIGVLVSLAIGTGVVNIMSGIAFTTLSSVVASIVTSMIAGITVGVMGGLEGFNLNKLAIFDIVFVIIISMIAGVIIGFIASKYYSELLLEIGVDTLRFFIYPFQVGLSLCSGFRGVSHPLEWDERVYFPLPRTRTFLTQKLQQNQEDGLLFVVEIGRSSSPFQRLAFRSVLPRFFQQHSDPLRFSYSLLTKPELEEYMSIPVRVHDWERISTVRRLIFGVLGFRFVEFYWTLFPIMFFGKLDWWLTSRFRKQSHTILTDFAGMIYDLLGEQSVEIERFNLSSYSNIYNNLSAYPGGDEIAHTFDALATFLSYHTLAVLPDATVISSHLRFDDPIRPTIITALQRLGAVGAEINVSQDSTSRANQMAALARATDMLKALREYVAAEVITPEQVILQQIIRQWQDLLISAGGELGRAEVAGPVANPFVVGNPVQGSLFVGREDVLRRLEELWRGEGQKPSIVLYGHRRMGKSSILHNLGARFGQEAVIIDFNMQRAGMVSSTGELLYNLALSIYDGLEASLRSLPAAAGFDLQEPVEERFLAHNPSIAFDRFLKQVDQIRQGKRLIIAIDEFELIEQKIKEGKLDPYLLDFCRGLIQSYAWFVIVFAGLHTLQEMARNYWNPLFGSVTGLMVSFLNDKAAQRLITQPTADFALDYDQDVIAEIIRLTHGQPYLIQLICHSLVSRFNQQTFEEGVERERRFTLADLHAVIDSPEFFRDGDAYFTGIWQQEQGAGIETQHRILQTLAQSETGLTENELAEQGQFAAEPVQEALEVLARHDVVTQTGHVWRFNVELMRRWIVRKEHVFR